MRLAPDLVLLIFLPPLLYSASFFADETLDRLRGIYNYLRNIVNDLDLEERRLAEARGS